MKQKAQLPEFKNEDELVAWVEANDTSEYMDELDDLGDDFDIVRTKFSTKPLEVRIRTEYWEAIEELAVRRGVPYQSLVQQWLLEKLNQEAPDLMTK
jgi:hypothetical protein